MTCRKTIESELNRTYTLKWEGLLRVGIEPFNSKLGLGFLVSIIIRIACQASDSSSDKLLLPCV